MPSHLPSPPPPSPMVPAADCEADDERERCAVRVGTEPCTASSLLGQTCIAISRPFYWASVAVECYGSDHGQKLAYSALQLAEGMSSYVTEFSLPEGIILSTALQGMRPGMEKHNASLPFNNAPALSAASEETHLAVQLGAHCEVLADGTAVHATPVSQYAVVVGSFFAPASSAAASFVRNSSASSRRRRLRMQKGLAGRTGRSESAAEESRVCTLDFLSRDEETGEPADAPDGDIVQEWFLMEALQHALAASAASAASVEGGSHNAYVCGLRRFPFAECLDLAGASTLSGYLPVRTAARLSFVASPFAETAALLRLSDQLLPNRSSRTMGAADGDEADARLFGLAETCGEQRVGDGAVDGMDMFVLAMAYFRVGPYAALGSSDEDVRTVGLRPDTADRCVPAPLSRPEWQLRVAFDACFAPQDEPAYQASLDRRPRSASANADTLSALLYPESEAEPLQSESPTASPSARSFGLDLLEWEAVNGSGVWYLLHIPRIQMASTIYLRGFEEAAFVGLSYAPSRIANRTGPPARPDEYTMLFQRHRESASLSADGCAVITAAGSQVAALHASVVSVSQRLDLIGGRRMLCAYDLFLWKPGPANSNGTSPVSNCSVAILAGSSAMDGVSGAVQAEEICASRAGRFAATAQQPSDGGAVFAVPPSKPPSPPRPVPTSFPLLPPAAAPPSAPSEGGASFPLEAVIISALFGAAGLVFLAYCLYKSFGRRRGNPLSQTSFAHVPFLRLPTLVYEPPAPPTDRQ